MDRYAGARQQLIDRELVPAGITNARVIDAIRQTPRHEFVSAGQRKNAYFDMALPIGAGQTISPPYVVAFMTQQLDPQPDDRVLEIGTGSGYQAAVLSHLVKEVYSIEIVASLGHRAAQTLRRLGYENVYTKVDDGYLGWAEHAPFDKIIVTCSPEKVPQPLIDQLAEGGRLVVPLGKRFQQSLYLFTKRNGELEPSALEATFFVPMTGQAEQERELQVNEALPGLVHGGFEETFADSDQPRGWFYVRLGRVAAGSDAPQGDHVLQFTNSTPGRMAHAMQSFGVDGQIVREMQLELSAQGSELQSGPTKQNSPRAIVEFYGESRAPVGSAFAGPWTGSFPWTRFSKTIEVPARAKLAVLGLGMFGGTGTISFDDVRITPMIDTAQPGQNLEEQNTSIEAPKGPHH